MLCFFGVYVFFIFIFEFVFRMHVTTAVQTKKWSHWNAFYVRLVGLSIPLVLMYLVNC